MINNLRFVINTESQKSVTTYVFVEYLSMLLEKNDFSVSVGDWEHYDKYDVALFVNKPARIDLIRDRNPGILIGICDPKAKEIRDSVPLVDFVTASSIEHKQILLSSNNNVFIYPVHRPVKARTKKAENKIPLVIAYQGNKVHLHTMTPNIISAIEWLGEEHRVEFWALYNIRDLGKWKIGTPNPKKVKTRHIQWEAESYCDYLWKADIGIVPNFIPLRNPQKAKRFTSVAPLLFLENDLDYLVRYKITSNTNRLYEFSQLGVPVVADMYPSACTLIRDGYSGFIAASAEGWYRALKELAESNEIRDHCASNLRSRMNEFYTPEGIFEDFIDFINEVMQRKREGKRAKLSHTMDESIRKKHFRAIRMIDRYERAKNLIAHRPDKTILKVIRQMFEG